MVAGATGRLGTAFLQAAARAGYPVVGAIRADPGGPRPPELPNGIEPVGPEQLEALLDGADVLVSACSPAAERANLPVAGRHRVPCVVATTGLGDPLPPWLRTVARQVPIVLDANFSLGVRWLRRALRSLGPMPEGFDVSIVETHRRSKADHPSGTAIALAGDLRGSGYAGWSNADGGRTRERVEVASLRGGDVPGVHVVQVEGPSELLRFEHLAFGRAAFATGMLAAARWLHAQRATLAPGLYSLDDVLGGPVP